MQLIGHVEGANVVLVDDMMDTGGTMCRAAKLIMDRGAKSVRAICTHPVMSGKAYGNISESVLTELVVTNTIPLHQNLDKIKVLSLGELFAQAIKKIHNHESISPLFLS
jgi:ribose-phosphate pyrophosphokinase